MCGSWVFSNPVTICLLLSSSILQSYYLYIATTTVILLRITIMLNRFIRRSTIQGIYDVNCTMCYHAYVLASSHVNNIINDRVKAGAMCNFTYYMWPSEWKPTQFAPYLNFTLLVHMFLYMENLLSWKFHCCWTLCYVDIHSFVSNTF